jgi:hypothetical protein
LIAIDDWMMRVAIDNFCDDDDEEEEEEELY